MIFWEVFSWICGATLRAGPKRDNRSIERPFIKYPGCSILHKTVPLSTQKNHSGVWSNKFLASGPVQSDHELRTAGDGMWVRAFGLRQLGAALLRQSASSDISMRVKGHNALASWEYHVWF